MSIDINDTIRALEDNGWKFQKNYINGEESYWGFDEDFSQEILIKINDMPDEENIEQFKQDLELVDEKKECRVNLIMKYGDNN